MVSSSARESLRTVVMRIMTDARVRTGVVIVITIFVTALLGIEIVAETEAAMEQCGPGCEVLG